MTLIRDIGVGKFDVDVAQVMTEVRQPVFVDNVASLRLSIDYVLRIGLEGRVGHQTHAPGACMRACA